MAESRDTNRYEVPLGVEIAASWAWRVLIIVGAGYVGYRFLSFFAEVTVPIAIAVLVTALAMPAVDRLTRWGVPRALSALMVVIGSLILLIGALTLVGQQISTQFGELQTKVVDGITQVQDWAKTGPLHLTDAQVEQWIERGKEAISSSNTSVLDRVSEVGTTLTHIFAGFFIVIFASYFFLYEGNRIFWWMTRIFPRGARASVMSSGEVAWKSLTAFVRATVLVALTDAIGIGVSAWLLGVPLSLAIGVIVFLGAFVPILGALVSGMVAVLVALVAVGPWTALFMLIAVIIVQQIETHVLQPFLMGTLVSVHPLAIIVAIAVGIIISGVVGALVAVPLAAAGNAVIKHLAELHGESPPPVEEQEELA
ncbi:MAG: family transporter [Nocardioidaceae bacterium]|nr:family transporter [Nocardioidaceae bacterium]